MQIYKHALILVHDETDGQLLLEHAERMAVQMKTQITVGHISEDYRELNYIWDAPAQDLQSRTIIKDKAMLSKLVETSQVNVHVSSIVSIHRFKDVSSLVENEQIDLVMLGHKNRLFGVYRSFSFEFINHLAVDVLIKHIPPS
ncbi:universal stress protein [Pantoea sp. App145]|uniref:universal stress protein n=1 Tax=Pantoea sp. App145 TaxID=3071567 RepID=UPI003A7FB862